MLFEGAERLDCSIDADYYAPRRIQINNSRISGRCAGQEHYAHEYLYIKEVDTPRGFIKHIDGHHYEKDSKSKLTDENLRNCIRDIQLLIDEASKTIETNIKLDIKEV